MRRRRTALFESWRGRYADSPRAISERLGERYPDLRRIWVADDPSSLPPGVEHVRRHTPEYFARLATTDFLVANDIVSRHVVKGPGVRYLQTWHGTPLKRIGLDEERPAYDSGGAHLRRMRRDVRHWDALVSPSPECTRLFQGAFGFEGPVLETGYPRNDLLRAPGAAEVGRRTRELLGVPEGARVVLYAPTWRDDRVAEDGRGFTDPGGLDVERFLSATDESVVLLVRMHSVVTSRLDGGHGSRAVDVSGHPDIAELYLASDLLVTDYSSTVFDFAVTGRPVVLFPYDLDDYDRGRGFYFDYHDWSPGPVVTTTEELAEAVGRALDPPGTGPWTPDARYRRFVERFCPLDDGGASDRVIDGFFAPVLDR